MKTNLAICSASILLSGGVLGLYAQEAVAPEPPRPLVLTEAIPMTGVQGRFDHFGFDGKNRLIVAALGNNTVEIIDTRWPMTLEHNFPMALDEADHRLFVATHEPARLAVLDTGTGRTIATLPCVQDADDLYYDSGRRRIYVPGGEGYISVFQQADADHYSLLAKVPSALGARTAGYFGKGKKGFDRFFLAVPARADHGAEIWIYTVQD